MWNDSEGVMVEAIGTPADLDLFLGRMRQEPPPLARIDSIEWASTSRPTVTSDFEIAPSRGGEVHTGVVPDAASCAACIAEAFDPADRRYRYPFVNCTHCGPRLSIVEAVPYDRASTSMRAFALCDDCRAEYDNPADRRFHAQPTACSVCGPQTWIERFGDAAECVAFDEQDAIAAAAARIQDGAIVAIKGLGGFHLACDAENEAAVAALRARKRRFDKPFALMARDLNIVRLYCRVDDDEAALLLSAAAPIVILERCDRAVALSVAPAQSTLGFMLPYTPLHHLLLAEFDRPLVMTSGNLSEEPQCTGNDEARRQLRKIADFGLFHDRGIVNRLDDSVVRVMAGAPRLLRRARGYAPAPMTLPRGFEQVGPLLAMGGELKSSFCLADGGQAIVSQHLGDLEDAATFDDYRKALDLYVDLFDHAPDAIAADFHPDYLSSKLGRELAAADDIGYVEVQHHHAHIASCLAENGIALDAPPVLGIALDGLGFGTDSALWGGEFLLADYAGFTRLGCFAPVAMPGGAQAVRQPWRNAYAHLDAAIGWDVCKRDYAGIDIVRALEAKPIGTIDAMIRNRINSPLASSCGRLFDAVAAAVGICRDHVTYEGQAAIELEAIVDIGALERNEGYPVAMRIDEDRGGLAVMDFGPLWRAILDDLAEATPAGVVAARFHRGLASAIAEMALMLVPRNVTTIALSGGSFQNRLLLEQVFRRLEEDGRIVLMQRHFPANDGGLALGQAAVAAAHQTAHRTLQTEELLPCA